MASVVARIKAADADIGANAEMDYKIVDGDGLGIFKTFRKKKYNLLFDITTHSF